MVLGQAQQATLPELEEKVSLAFETLSERPERHRALLQDIREKLQDASQAPEQINELISAMEGIVIDFGDDTELHAAITEMSEVATEILGDLQSRDNPSEDLITRVNDVIARNQARDIERAQIVVEAQNMVRLLKRNKNEISDLYAVLTLEEANKEFDAYFEEVEGVLTDVSDFVNEATSPSENETDSP